MGRIDEMPGAEWVTGNSSYGRAFSWKLPHLTLENWGKTTNITNVGKAFSSPFPLHQKLHLWVSLMMQMWGMLGKEHKGLLVLWPHFRWQPLKFRPLTMHVNGHFIWHHSNDDVNVIPCCECLQCTHSALWVHWSSMNPCGKPMRQVQSLSPLSGATERSGTSQGHKLICSWSEPSGPEAVFTISLPPRDRSLPYGLFRDMTEDGKTTIVLSQGASGLVKPCSPVPLPAQHWLSPQPVSELIPEGA